MLWLGALVLLFAGALLGGVIGDWWGTRSGFREGYIRGLKKQITVDDFLGVLDHAAREADGPERPEVN